jgi:hypothetical protein
MPSVLDALKRKEFFSLSLFGLFFFVHVTPQPFLKLPVILLYTYQIKVVFSRDISWAQIKSLLETL